MQRPRRRGLRAQGWLAGLAFLVALSQACRAHDTWVDGRPIPDWVKRACCGPADAHHLRPDQVQRVRDGFRIEGYPGEVYDSQVLPSEDGEYWAFYARATGASGAEIFTSVFCFFAPGWS